MRTKSVTVAVGVLRDSTPLVSIGVADLLRKSSDLAAQLPGKWPSPAFDVRLVGEERTVRASGGYSVNCDTTFARTPRCDLAVIPALDPEVVAHLEDNRAAVAWAKRMHLAGARLASACTGAFVLAEAGLLDGRRATTHWAYQAQFTARYPKVKLEPQAVLVDQGAVCTSGGATSFINLALYLVERTFGPELAFQASRMFLIDVNKAPQGAYAVFSTQKDHGDEEILEAQELMERDLGRRTSVGSIAKSVAMSPRTFVRRFKQATGNAPREYLQRARVEAAKRALERTRHALQTIAADVGYGDLVAFRRIFNRFTGLTPGDYRRRYGAFSSPELIQVPARAPRAKLRAER